MNEAGALALTGAVVMLATVVVATYSDASRRLMEPGRRKLRRLAWALFTSSCALLITAIWVQVMIG